MKNDFMRLPSCAILQVMGFRSYLGMGLIILWEVLEMMNAFNPQALQSESLTLNFPIQTVYSAVLATAEETRGFKLREENRLLFRISIQTKISALSWGELLTVQLNDMGHKTGLTISSQHKTAFGSLALGAQATIGRKNKKNIDSFLRELSKRLH